MEAPNTMSGFYKHFIYKIAMKHILKILDISGADIARHAGISRQAVSQGSIKADRAAAALLDMSRLNPDHITVLQEAATEIATFLRESTNGL